MCKKLIYFVFFVLVLGMVSSAYAVNIIWVSDASDVNGDGVLDDRGWVDLLRAEGYIVDYKGEAGSGAPDYRYWQTLDDAKIAELNGADLVIVSRDTNSGLYINGEEPTQWNSVTTPLILQNVYLVRQSRWLWFNTNSLLQNGDAPTLEAVDPGHPIFYSVPLGPSNQVDILDGVVGHTSFIQATDAGNGTMIAKRADNDWAFIAEWDPGVEFYTGAGQTAGGRRMLFTAGRGEAAPAPPGEYNLTAEGEILFLNAVRYMLGGAEMASRPSPADGATDVPRDVVLSWKPGVYAPTVNGHKVFLSENFDDVNDGIGGVTQDPNFYPVGATLYLDIGQTYYWRVDEATSVTAWNQGDVWQFTVEPFAYPIENVTTTASSTNRADEGPENTINGSGLDDDDLHSSENADMWLSSAVDPNAAWIQYEFDKIHKLYQMWVWNYNSSVEPVVGFGVKEVTIEYSVDGADWAILGTAHEFARGSGVAGYAPNTTVDLGGVAAKYVKITANSNWGGIVNQYGLSEVRFLYIPLWAREPSPDSGATDVDVDVTLSFRAGREAANHDVYLSTDEQAVIDGTTPVTTVTEPSYVSSLDLASTYYWRIDEVNDVEIPTTWQGDIWNLSTQEYLVVDDFEFYNDIPVEQEGSNLVYMTWVDGFGTTTNGSTIGYTEAFQPSIEKTLIYDGKQSVPLFYDNTKASFSEVTANVADLQAGQDWAKHGIRALTLRFLGDPNNVLQQLYVKINDTKVTYDGDAEDLRQAGWQMWYIDLASLGVNLSNVTALTIGFERIGTAGGQGMAYLDGIRLYSYDRQSITPVDPGTAGLQAHYQFEDNTNDSSGNACHGTEMGHPTFVAGKIGQAINLRGLNDYVLIEGSYLLPLYSAALWFRVDGGTGSRAVLSVHDSVGENDVHGIMLEVESSGQLRFLHRFPFTTGGTNIYTDTTYDDGAWHHAVMVKSADTMTLYVDGQQVGLAADNTQFDQALSWITLGVLTRNQLMRYFPGAIDDVRIYDRALSQEEIAWLAGRTKAFDKPF